MTLASHQMSRAAFTAMASGGGGADAIARLLAARRSRNLVLLRTLVDLTIAADHEAARAATDAYLMLSEIERLAPRSVAAILNYPSVTAWIIDTVMLLHQGRLADAQPARLAAVAAAAAIRGAVPGTFDIPVINPRSHTIMLPSVGAGTFSSSTGDTVRLHTTANGATLCRGGSRIEIPADPHQDAPRWRAIRRISAACAGLRIDLRIDGAGSYQLPGKVTAQADLPDHQLDVWQTTITRGWQVLVKHHPETAAEVAAMYTTLVPLSGVRAGQASATFQDAVGCVAMSLPPNAEQTALILAHEVQHAKLCALMDIFPLIEPGADAVGYAPWRDDPRPLIALLQGTYAHLGVAGFWRRHRHHKSDRAPARHAEVQFARWRDAAHEVADFLATSEWLTPQGLDFVATMLAVLDMWRAEDLPADVRATVKKLDAEHRERWVATNGKNESCSVLQRISDP